MASIDWPRQAFDELKRLDVRQVAYVPDAGHGRLISLCDADPAIRSVSLTTEEEGVAMLAGAWLGRARRAAAAIQRRRQLHQHAVVEPLLQGGGRVLVTVKVTTEPGPSVIPPRDGPYLRSRFREALLGAEAHR